MRWHDDELKNPLTGATLRRDSPHSFSDGATRFPIIGEIPYLRANRDDLCGAVLRKLDAGDERGALILLLREQDDWARTAPPTVVDLEPLWETENLNLRAAMRCLRYGAVADYFAYRWSDPTFLSGLCLLENHLPDAAKNVFELCCGIGHYLREFEWRNIAATGADVVFSKLWLARKFVAPTAKLICFDANFDFPFAEKIFDAAFCHDAFYFLPRKKHVVVELERTTSGAILIGHAHSAEAENFSSGAAISVAEYAALFENPTLYDDAELTRALIENRTPQTRTAEELKKTEAVAIIETKGDTSSKTNFATPLPHRRLRVNPLLDAGNFELRDAPDYPSQRYAEEYAPLSDYLELNGAKISIAEREKLAAGDWKNDENLVDLARRRIFLDLPDDW